MKKASTLFFLFLLFTGYVFSTPIKESSAKLIGQNFLMNKTSSASFKTGVTLELAYSSISKITSSNASITPTTYFYVFNVSNGNGFVIVSGDDQAKPILAYSDEKDFDIANIAPQTAKWLEGYKDQIRYIIQNNISQTDAIAQEWKTLNEEKIPTNTLNKKGSVSPLVQTQWDQSPYYNALCPFDAAENQRTVTGCVATAMAQVMKFWNYPTQGSGFHSYDHPNYGTLSANFGSTTYDWASMPNTLTSNNTAVATLMFQLGVSVDMNYGVGSKGGSGSYVISAQSPVTNCTEYALQEYFGYKNTLQGLQRNNYSDATWLSMLKSELDAGRPIIYAGFGSGGGHCFVNDGYDNNDFFHFNWGWSGYYNGYFSIDALNPGGVGTGGGTGGFNSNHQAVIGIEPPSGSEAETYGLQISSDVIIDPSTIGYGGAFNVFTNITNTGTTTFKGTYCAAIIDQNDYLVDYTDSLQELNGLPPGYTYNGDLTFPSPGNLKILPGNNYKIYILFKPIGGNWQRLVSSGSVIDFGTLDVVNQNDIELYDNMVPTPTSFVKGQSATVKLDIVNWGTSTFNGAANLSLFGLDGTFAATIEEKTSLSLPTNTHFQNGLTFSTSSLDVAPGTYLLALQINRNGSSSYELVGSTSFQNPIKVTVVEAPFNPDAYEVNNTVAQAYNLTLSYTNNVAVRKTTGSNCHTGTDYDYYKLVLPTGYTYSINARIHDSYSSATSETYSIDALLSYSKDGTTWSEAYDDIIPNPISVNGGTTLYFLVSPYFTGETGTYLFDATITRKPLTGVNETSLDNVVTIYPNPAKEIINIDLNDLKVAINSVSLITIQGQKVKSTTTFNNNPSIQILLNDVAEGMYILNIETSQGVIKKKVLIQK